MNLYPWWYKVEGCVCVGGGKWKQKCIFFKNEPFILKRTIWPQLTITDYVVFNLLPLLQVLRFW